MFNSKCKTCENLHKVIDATFDFLIANNCDEVLLAGTFHHKDCEQNGMFYTDKGIGKVKGIGVLEQIKFRVLGNSFEEND